MPHPASAAPSPPPAVQADPEPGARSPRLDDDAPLRLLCSANERFALSLAVMLHSALTHTTSRPTMDIVVADMGLSTTSRRKLQAVVHRAPLDASIRFRQPDVGTLEGLYTNDWHRLPIYFRLLMDQLVPDDWDRLLYLDSDVLVQADLGRLWRTPIGDGVALGVIDFRVPTVWWRDELRDVYTDALHLPPETPYCNSGVMLLNLKAWRAENIGQRSLAFLRQYPDHTYYPDQDALNAIIAGRWTLVDPRWNVALSAVPYYGYPDQETPAMRDEQTCLLNDPFIIHYTGPSKPWHHLYRREFSDRFLDMLRQSGWLDAPQSWWWMGSRRVTHTAAHTAQRAARAVGATDL